MTDWADFRRRFEENRRRALPAIIQELGVDDAWRGELAASLARFQLGEAGEGRIATEIDHFHARSIDADYRAALKLFVREEARHAVILGHLVRALGGRLIERTWTERLFVYGRRLSGIRLKLLVLLAAEIVGVGFYRTIALRLGEGAVREALAEICLDEEHHLAFHRAFFRQTASAVWFVPLLLLLGGAACAVVLVDHRRTLRTLGIPIGEAARALGALLVSTAFEPLPEPVTAKT
jgi:hypothetical protein